jgi:hypothetical protein
MIYLPDLKTLGLTAFALVSIVTPLPALAQMQTYYHTGVWDAFSGRNEQGRAVCGIGNTNPIDNRRLAIRFPIEGTDTVFSVSKPDWSIPDNTRVTVVMQVGLNTPWTEAGNGHGHSIDWPMDRSAAQPFDQQFRGASSMTLTFPDGNEPSWTISLAGSSAISDAFGRCVRDLTRQVQAAQAAGINPPQPQGVAPGPTQPFGPAAGNPPAEAPPAGSPTQPTATQPNAAPPAGPQPNPDQPGGPQPPR